MAQYTHLKNAPITEALIDMRVKPSPSVDCGKIGDVYDKLQNQYPEKKEIREGKFALGFKEGEPSPLQSENVATIGYSFLSSEKTRIVQYRTNGFTFNWLKPYTTWDELRDVAKPLWDLYTETTAPEYVSRIALRYINKIELPLPVRDFSDYLTIPPIIPDSLPQELSSFLTRVVVPEPSNKFVAIITQALESVDAKSKTAPVFFDIDVFKEVEYDVNAKELWDILEELRVFKNNIFFEYITQKTVELFK